MLPNAWKTATALLAVAAIPFTAAERIIRSTSLNPCMTNSRLSASLFNVAFTPDNRSLAFHIEGIADISGRVDVSMELIVYGYSALNQKLDPCDKSNGEDLDGLCPMIPGPLSIDSNLDLGQDVINSIPGTPLPSQRLFYC